MGSLPNIDTELFYFIAATKLALIRSEGKTNVSLWSLHSISPREAHNQSFRVLRFFLEKWLSCHEWKLFQVRIYSHVSVSFLATLCPYTPAGKWAQSWEWALVGLNPVSAS